MQRQDQPLPPYKPEEKGPRPVSAVKGTEQPTAMVPGKTNQPTATVKGTEQPKVAVSETEQLTASERSVEKPTATGRGVEKPTAAVAGTKKLPLLMPCRGAVQRGRRRVRTLMTPRRFHPPTKEMQLSSSDNSDEESVCASRGSHESMESADERGSGSDTEDSGSDDSPNEPYSPPKFEDEAPEDKIRVIKPPAKKSAAQEIEESDEISSELEEESLKELAEKEAALKKELRIPVKETEKKKKKNLTADTSSTSKGEAKALLGPDTTGEYDPEPEQEPGAKRLKSSE